MRIRWKYAKALESEDRIGAFEAEAGYVFDEAFKACVRANNGGRPDPCAFDTERAKGRTVKSLLSFDESDKAGIRAVNAAAFGGIDGPYIAFAGDNFGNLLCFERAGGRVVFWDHETGGTEAVAPDFEAFLRKLYDTEQPPQNPLSKK